MWFFSLRTSSELQWTLQMEDSQRCFHIGNLIGGSNWSALNNSYSNTVKDARSIMANKGMTILQHHEMDVIDALPGPHLFKDEEWRFLIALCRYTGARLGEGIVLDRSDVFSRSGYVCVRLTSWCMKLTAEGNVRVLPLSKKAIPMMAELLDRVRSGNLFSCVTRKSSRNIVSTRTFNRIYKSVSSWVDTSSCFIHGLSSFRSIRHYCASELSRNGVSYDTLHYILSGRSSRIPSMRSLRMAVDLIY